MELVRLIVVISVVAIVFFSIYFGSDFNLSIVSSNRVDKRRCGSNKQIITHSDGSSVVPLTEEGTRCFISERHYHRSWHLHINIGDGLRKSFRSAKAAIFFDRSSSAQPSGSSESEARRGRDRPRPRPRSEEPVVESPPPPPSSASGDNGGFVIMMLMITGVGVMYHLLTFLP